MISKYPPTAKHITSASTRQTLLFVNGVSNAELENAKELRRFAEFLGEQVDGIYGEGTAKILTGGRCEPSELIRFICETAKYFTQTSDQLIRHYTEAVQGGVMK